MLDNDFWEGGGREALIVCNWSMAGIVLKKAGKIFSGVSLYIGIFDSPDSGFDTHFWRGNHLGLVWR